MNRAIAPFHHVFVRAPEGRRPAAALSDDVLGSLDHGHARGEGDPGAAGDVGEACRFRIRHHYANALIGHAEGFRGHEGHGGPGAADVRIPFNDGYRAILIDVHFRGGLKPHVEPEAHGHAPAHAGVLGLRVMGMGRRRFQARPQTNGTKLRAVDGRVPFLHGVAEAQLDRIDSELLRGFVHGTFRGEERLGRAGGTIGGSLRLIHQHVHALDAEVGNPIGGEHAHGARAHGGAGEGPGLIGHDGFCCGDLAVRGEAHAQIDGGRRRGAGGAEDLFPGHHHAYRAAALLRELQGQRLEVDRGLSSKTPTNFTGNHFQGTHGLAQHLRRHGAHIESALGTAPQHCLIVLAPAAHASMGLDVALVHRRRLVASLDDERSLRKARL